MIDWTAATSFEQAAKNVRSDSYGDWYRDPWGWPENEWVAMKAPHILSARLNDRGSKRALPVAVPKENFVLRPAMIMEPVDRLAYQALVDSISRDLIGDMRGFVFGWRLPTRDPEKGRYEGLLDIGMDKPNRWFDVPEEERERRIQLTSDTCIIRGERACIR